MINDNRPDRQTEANDEILTGHELPNIMKIDCFQVRYTQYVIGLFDSLLVRMWTFSELEMPRTTLLSYFRHNQHF